MKKLKYLRHSRNLTQQKLAVKSGVSQSYINELENGKKKNPSTLVITKLARALNATVSDLLDDEDSWQVKENGIHMAI